MLAHYAALALVVAACWGTGRSLLQAGAAPVPKPDALLSESLATALGLGLAICALQAAAIVSALTRSTVFGLLGAGLALAAWQAHRIAPAMRRWRPAPPHGPAERAALALAGLAALTRVLAPLAPPFAFDETMYHLPYAREVAASGTLGVHGWLHFPWFPFNYDLLYSAALLAYDDVFAHLLHALAAALATLIVWCLGARYLNVVVAGVAATIWLALGDFETALIDSGVALFVLVAFAALAIGCETPHGPAKRWLALSAFSLGVAAGSKYQALVFVPLALALLAARTRHPAPWALAAACFLLPCVYWYARNGLLTGDPFNPMGARLFGFSSWNAEDMRIQFEDIRNRAQWPSALLWPVVLMPWHPAWREPLRRAAVRALALFCIYALGAWALSSRYPRYLVPSVPLVALGAAMGWQVLGSLCGRAWRAGPATLQRSGPFLQAGAWALLAAVALQHLAADARRISPTAEARDAWLRRALPGYGLMAWLRAHPQGRVYQVAMSDAIYYGPAPVWGDVFGPWRYGDFIGLPPAQLAARLHSFGFEVLALDTRVAAGIDTQPGFGRHFALIHQDGVGKAFRVLGHEGVEPVPRPWAPEDAHDRPPDARAQQYADGRLLSKP